MRKILQRNEKVELNSFIEEFVKTRQKYFTPGQEWLEAELAEEKISVYTDKAQLEKDLDELIKTSLMYGKVRNLEMKIQVKKTADGAEILIHIGLDTVELKGEPFDQKVKEGQDVKKGDLLVVADLDKIKASGRETITPMIICNSDAYEQVETFTGKDVETTDAVMKLHPAK